MSIKENIISNFKENFTLKEAYEINSDSNKESVRARIYENIGKSFEKVSKGIYKVKTNIGDCLVIESDGRDLSSIEDNSIDCIITDHPWEDTKSNKGGSRNFCLYESFKYELKDFKEKSRVLKQGHFLVEMLPAENENNYEYLFEIKKMAKECGLEYYAKVNWKKGSFVSNTGRKSKNTEEIMFFTKGKARSMRPDVKKNLAFPGTENFMSGTKKMLPTMFDIEPVQKSKRIHQAEKPLELIIEILNLLTEESDIVLDQFAGSGVIGEACIKTKRKSILIEKNKDDVEKIINRLEAIR